VCGEVKYNSFESLSEFISFGDFFFKHAERHKLGERNSFGSGRVFNASFEGKTRSVSMIFSVYPAAAALNIGLMCEVFELGTEITDPIKCYDDVSRDHTTGTNRQENMQPVRWPKVQ